MRVVELAEKTITAPKARRISVAVSIRLYSTEVGAFCSFPRPFEGARRSCFGRSTVFDFFFRRSGTDLPHQFPETLAALLVVTELVEAGAGRGKQDRLAEQGVAGGQADRSRQVTAVV